MHFPEGLIRSDITSVFNHDQIVRIDFTGFSDDESKKFLEKLKIKEQQKQKEKLEESKFIVNEQPYL